MATALNTVALKPIEVELLLSSLDAQRASLQAQAELFGIDEMRRYELLLQVVHVATLELSITRQLGIKQDT